MKEKLYINKRLPYIKLPKEKLNLFIDWYNIDLKSLDEIPEVFNEGYLELDTSDYISVKLPSIFDVNGEREYEQLMEMNNITKTTYSKVIVHFQIMNKETVKLVGYYGNGNYAFRIIQLWTKNNIGNINEFKHLLNTKFKNTTIDFDDKTGENIEENEEEHNKLANKLYIDLVYKSYNTMEEMQAAMKKLSSELGDVCVGLLKSVIWYLATNKSEKYLVNSTSVNDVSHSKSNKQYKHQYRNITTPIYNLVDNRPVTIERLIKKRNGWTISHSFQVRGHYRHYRNGKVVFIKSYEKGKDIGNFQNTLLTLNPQG